MSTCKYILTKIKALCISNILIFRGITIAIKYLKNLFTYNAQQQKIYAFYTPILFSLFLNVL